MKNIIFYFSAISMSLILGACNKSNEKRIVGTWQVSKVIRSGNDISSLYLATSYTETYTSDGKYTYTGQPDGKSGSGQYKWDGSTLFKRSGVSGQSSADCVIKNLTTKELDYTTTLSGEPWEFVFTLK